MGGHLPTFDAYQAPTEHPLYLAVCAVVLGLLHEQHIRPQLIDDP